MSIKIIFGTNRSIWDTKRIFILSFAILIKHISNTIFFFKKYPTPWKALVTSGPVWALFITQSGNNYCLWTLMTQIPTYMNYVMHFNIKDVSIIISTSTLYRYNIRTYSCAIQSALLFPCEFIGYDVMANSFVPDPRRHDVLETSWSIIPIASLMLK